jgi:hypothetical protein
MMALLSRSSLCRFETAGKAALVNIGWGFGPGGIQLSGSHGRLIVRYQGDTSLLPAERHVATGTAKQFEVGAPTIPTPAGRALRAHHERKGPTRLVRTGTGR